MQLEFYNYEDQVWFRNAETNTCEQLTENKKEVIAYMIDRIETLYPEAYKALAKTFKELTINQSMFRHRIVKRFCKCNFSAIDQTLMDVDSIGTFNFEHVSCPLRGECRSYGIICNAKRNTKLSASEMRILKMYCEPMEIREIADQLYISIRTAETHIKNIRRKLDLHSKAELMKYVNINF